jgi:hypothetical protein
MPQTPFAICGNYPLVTLHLPKIIATTLSTVNGVWAKENRDTNDVYLGIATAPSQSPIFSIVQTTLELM